MSREGGLWSDDSPTCKSHCIHKMISTFYLEKSAVRCTHTVVNKGRRWIMSSLTDGTVRVQCTPSTSLWIILKIHKKKTYVLTLPLVYGAKVVKLYCCTALCELIMGRIYQMLHQLTRFVFIFIISIVVGLKHDAEQFGSCETDTPGSIILYILLSFVRLCDAE